MIYYDDDMILMMVMIRIQNKNNKIIKILCKYLLYKVNILHLISCADYRQLILEVRGYVTN